MRAALLALAKLTHTKIDEAHFAIRKNTLFGEEIGIQEELINLEEAIRFYNIITVDTLVHYPVLQRHLINERKDILMHCIGLIDRMIHKKVHVRDSDIKIFLSKLIRLVVMDSRLVGYKIENSIMEEFWPYLSLWQRIIYKKVIYQNIIFGYFGSGAN